MWQLARAIVPPAEHRPMGIFTAAELDAVTTLIEMGFQRDAALTSLLGVHWDLSQAVEALATTPTTALDPPDSCPICLEPPTASLNLLCGHFLCTACFRELVETPHPLCPLCRAPLTQPSPDAPPDVPLAPLLWTGYLLIQAPAYMGDVIGFHPVDWNTIEARLHIPPGDLAGHLHLYRIQLRRCETLQEVEVWCRRFRLPCPPRRHEA
jgi:hypothetical protein